MMAKRQIKELDDLNSLEEPTSKVQVHGVITVVSPLKQGRKSLPEMDVVHFYASVGGRSHGAYDSLFVFVCMYVSVCLSAGFLVAR